MNTPQWWLLVVENRDVWIDGIKKRCSSKMYEIAIDLAEGKDTTAYMRFDGKTYELIRETPMKDALDMSKGELKQ